MSVTLKNSTFSLNCKNNGYFLFKTYYFNGTKLYSYKTSKIKLPFHSFLTNIPRIVNFEESNSTAEE